MALNVKRHLTVTATGAPAAFGDGFEVSFDLEEPLFVFRRIASKVGWLAVLRECPEGMDNIPSRRLKLLSALRIL